MTNRRLKKKYILGIYTIGIVMFIGILYFVELALMETTFTKDKDYIYVNKTIFEEEIPVIASSKNIIKPYLDNSVKILRDFYEKDDSLQDQEKSLFYYEGTYIQSTAICYGSSNKFDVVSILDGKVIDTKKDDILGYIIQIEHSPNVISIYQSLSEVVVEKDATVKQGQIIGKSGTSNMNKDLGNHLMFELIINSENVNPEDYYDKSIDEL